MDVMFPEAFTAEYEEFVALMQGETYTIVYNINSCLFEYPVWALWNIDFEFDTKEEAWQVMETLENDHPDYSFMTLTVTELDAYLQGKLWL